jgi:hypothetical protein
MFLLTIQTASKEHNLTILKTLANNGCLVASFNRFLTTTIVPYHDLNNQNKITSIEALSFNRLILMEKWCRIGVELMLSPDIV